MEYKNIILKKNAGIARLTINRPDKLNALNSDTLTEIGHAMDDIGADVSVRVVILTGAGEKAFVAGADIKELSGLDAAGGKHFAAHGQGVFDKIESSTRPVIAAINGFALGGGCELALACHIRICSDNARFGQPEVNLGLIPGAGGTQRLPRVVGRGNAIYLITTGDTIKAEEALRIGLVSRITAPSELMSVAEEIAGKIMARGPVAIGYALEAIRRGTEMSQPDALGFEAALFGLCFATEDMKEGTRAFVEKRTAAFKGK